MTEQLRAKIAALHIYGEDKGWDFIKRTEVLQLLDRERLAAAPETARTPYGVVPANNRLILASENLLDDWVTRTERGERITVEWGEPSSEGWYTPTFTVHSDDILAAARLPAPSTPPAEEAGHQHEFKCLTCEARFPRGHRFPSMLDPAPSTPDGGLDEHGLGGLREALLEILEQFNRDNIRPGQAAFNMAAIAERALAAAASSADAGAGGLAEAWEAAEAALWEARERGFGGGFPLSVTANAPLRDDYTAAASMTEADGPTPAAALLALAARLQAADEGGETR